MWLENITKFRFKHPKFIRRDPVMGRGSNKINNRAMKTWWPRWWRTSKSAMCLDREAKQPRRVLNPASSGESNMRLKSLELITTGTLRGGEDLCIVKPRLLGFQTGSQTRDINALILACKTTRHAATWMDQEMIILSEVSQTEKDKYHMTSLICGV